MRRFFVALAVAVAVGCGGDSGTGPTSNVAGNWTGTLQTAGVTANITMQLQQSGQTVTGNGSISNQNAGIALTLHGTYQAPTLSLTVSTPGFQDGNVAGSVSGKTFVGSFNGSGINNGAVTLTKQ